MGCVVIVLEKTALLITMVGEKTLMGGIPGEVSITACETANIQKQNNIWRLLTEHPTTNLVARNDENWKYNREDTASNDLK